MCGISFGWHDDLERKSKVNDSDLFCSPGREREKERETVRTASYCYILTIITMPQ